jgi:hypothetical protein
MRQAKPVGQALAEAVLQATRQCPVRWSAAWSE